MLLLVALFETKKVTFDGIGLSEGLWLIDRFGENTGMSFRSLVGGLPRKNYTDLAAAELTCDRVVLNTFKGTKLFIIHYLEC